MVATSLLPWPWVLVSIRAVHGILEETASVQERLCLRVLGYYRIGRTARGTRHGMISILGKTPEYASEERVAEVLENPYMQAFCGFRSMATEDVLDTSMLAKIRGKLGLSFFRYMEEKTYEVLIERRIIRKKGMLLDATVFPEAIK